MFYTIYKTTNILNGKFYIGKHQTKDLADNYLGSGKRLKHAIIKHGIENFIKEILYIFDNEADMNSKEKELVTAEFCLNENTYNICEGGKGGFGYINNIGNPKRGFTIEEKRRGGFTSGNIQKTLKKGFFSYSAEQRSINSSKSFLGKNHTNEWKQKHSLHMKGKFTGTKNSQFGTCWITNGTSNKKIKKEELSHWLLMGYSKGRKI